MFKAFVLPVSDQSSGNRILRRKSENHSAQLTKHTCLGIYSRGHNSPQQDPRKATALGGIVKKGLPEFSERSARRNGLCIGTGSTRRQAPECQALEREGPGILEIVEDHRGDTYRAIYSVRFADAVYVLHAFQKKSKQGIKTPQTDVKLIPERLKRAQADYESRGKP